jgi:hypothetical protein
MNKRSTSTQLVQFYDKVFKAIDNSKQFDTIYLDFSKAFDCIPHDLLLHKLRRYGFNDRLLKWFGNYLTNRRQRVVIDGSKSKYLLVKSGVPQGSILGPLLFLYYINDIFSYINDFDVDLSLYADDAKIGKQINSINDCFIIQRCLDNLINWSKIWGMEFNIRKCVVMSFSNCKNKVIFDYIMNNSRLIRDNSFVDLGVTITDNLTWDKHIENCVTKANKRLGLIKRCTGYKCSMNVKLKCYTSLVRPILEYNTVIWSCNNKRMLCKVESLQRRATKYIVADFNIDYKSRLILCNLLPLSLRRQFLDCVFVYNSLMNLNDLNILSYLGMVNLNATNTRYQTNLDELMFKTSRTLHELYGKFITKRIIGLWNVIPYNIRSLELTEQGYNSTFKKALKNWFGEYFAENFSTDHTCTWLVKCSCSDCRLT